MLSIVIPTFNEGQSQFLKKILTSICGQDCLEVICVDGGSCDETIDTIEKSCAKLIKIKTQSRAMRLNYGIQQARGPMILLHHPRSLIDPKAIECLCTHGDEPIWGGLTHRFDQDSPFYRFTSWYSNQIRLKLKHIIYLDHCIFFHKKLVTGDPSPVPPVDIFEDTAFSYKLQKHGAPILLPFHSTTSAIRFEKNGKWRQGVMNQVLKVGLYCKISHTTMNKIYEKGLSLNSKYPS